MPATVRTSLLIALAALCAHAGALSAGWIWDDGDYITANRIVQSPDGFLTLWLPGATPQFYPLVFLGFWIEHAIVGNDPWLYHANNMLLHAGSALLLWLMLRRIGVPLAAWIAVVFAVHPMGVESVAWATERKNTQSLLLALASVLAFLRAEKIDAREPAPAKEAAGQGLAGLTQAPLLANTNQPDRQSRAFSAFVLQPGFPWPFTPKSPTRSSRPSSRPMTSVPCCP